MVIFTYKFLLGLLNGSLDLILFITVLLSTLTIVIALVLLGTAILLVVYLLECLSIDGYVALHHHAFE